MLKTNHIQSNSDTGVSIKPFISLTELRATTTEQCLANNIVQVLDSGTDTLTDYYWNATSTAADNGTTVIKPTAVATGRWLKVGSGYVTEADVNDLLTNKTFFTVSVIADWVIPNVDNSAENNVIPFDEMLIDNLSEVDLLTGIFTATQAGFYIFIININAVLAGTTDASSPNTIVQILKNGGSITYSAPENGRHNRTTPIVSLAIGDTVKCVVTDTAIVGTESKSIFANSTFSGYRIN